MQLPTPEQVEVMMREKFGTIPASLESAKRIDPSFFVDQAMSSKTSIMSEKNALDPKTSSIVFLAAAIAMGDAECMEVNTKALKKMGATNEEILSVIRIVRHAASSGVIGKAKPIFDLL